MRLLIRYLDASQWRSLPLRPAELGDDATTQDIGLEFGSALQHFELELPVTARKAFTVVLEPDIWQGGPR